MRRKYALLFLLLVTPALFSQKGKTEMHWKYWKTKKDVQFFKRSFPNSGIIEVKAVTVIDAAPEVIETVIRDIPAYPEFMYECIEVREIKKFDDDNIIIFNVTKLPWPLEPRDVVVTTKVKNDFTNGRFEVALVGLKPPESEKYVSPIKGHVRMHELTVTFQCELLERNKCRMTYIVNADPSGLPSIVVNLFVDDDPYGNLQGLKKMVVRDKYRELGKKSKYLKLIEKYFASKKQT